MQDDPNLQSNPIIVTFLRPGSRAKEALHLCRHYQGWQFPVQPALLPEPPAGCEAFAVEMGRAPIK